MQTLHFVMSPHTKDSSRRYTNQIKYLLFNRVIIWNINNNDIYWHINDEVWHSVRTNSTFIELNLDRVQRRNFKILKKNTSLILSVGSKQYTKAVPKLLSLAQKRSINRNKLSVLETSISVINRY